MALGGEQGAGKIPGFSFTWQIEDFTLCLLNKKLMIDSPVFRIKQLRNSEWKLMLYLPGDNEENIILNLCRCKNGLNDPSEICVDVRLFISKTDGSYVFKDKEKSLFLPINHTFQQPLSLSRKTILEDPNTYLLRDTLIVGFHMFISSETSPLADIPVECNACSKLIWTKYSILLPLKFPGKSSNYEYSVTSPIASTSTEHPEFQIELHCYDCNKHERPVTIIIHVVKSGFKGILMCKLSFLTNGIIKFMSKTNYNFKPEMNGPAGRIDISKETFNKYSISSSNCLKCELFASTGKFSSTLENTTYKPEIPDASTNNCSVSYLQSNLREMHEKKILCDFKVIVSGREFSVHRTILSAVSPVFRCMFESNMSEADESQMTIEDFSVEAVEKMLEFSYCEEVKDLNWKAAIELYSIADKYQIQKLIAICHSFLESGLGVETVPDLLTLADLHKDTHLSQVAENFICFNSKAVFQSKAWENFKKINIQVASETMHHHICKLLSENNINPLN